MPEEGSATGAQPALPLPHPGRDGPEAVFPREMCTAEHSACTVHVTPWQAAGTAASGNAEERGRPSMLSAEDGRLCSRSRDPLARQIARQAGSAAQGGTNRLNRQRGRNRTACSEPGDGGRRPAILQPASPISSIASRSRTRALPGEDQPVNWSIGVLPACRRQLRATTPGFGNCSHTAKGRPRRAEDTPQGLEQGPSRSTRPFAPTAGCFGAVSQATHQPAPRSSVVNTAESRMAETTIDTAISPTWEASTVAASATTAARPSISIWRCRPRIQSGIQ